MKTVLVSINARYIHAGLAVRQLFCACKAQGLDAEIYECDINRNCESIVRDIARKQPDVVGFCCYIWNIGLVEQVARNLKLACPRVHILWGGPEVTYNARERLLHNPAVEAVLCGEGEITLPRTLAQLEAGERPHGSGVVTRESDEGIAPMLEAEQWMDVYADESALDANRLWYIETVRGCPYGCRYCLSSAIDGLRALPAQEAVRRLLHMRDIGAKVIKLVDRTFNFDRARAREIWKALIGRGGGATYHFEIAANLLDAEDMAILAQAPEGLFQLEIGVQTTTKSTLGRIGRTLEFEKIAHAVHILHRMGSIPVHMDLIAGLPGDSLETFARAFDDVLALEPNRLQLGFLKLLHGSPMRADFDSGAGVYSPDAPYEVIAGDAISYADLCRLKDVEEVVEIFYNTHAFPLTAQAYLKSFSDFASAAEALRENGFFDAGQGEMARYAHFYRALLKKADDAALLENRLRYDWLKSKKRLVRPDFMDAEREFSDMRLRLITENAAQRRGMHVERFDYEVHSGKKRAVVLLFDYVRNTVEELLP